MSSWLTTPSAHKQVNEPGLAGFCQKVEKTGFFPWKKLDWQNSFCWQK